MALQVSQIKNLEINIGLARHTAEELNIQEGKIKQRIAETETKLTQLVIEFNEKKDNEKDVMKIHDDKQQRRDQLYGKQARGNQYKSVAERNKALDKEINENKKRLDKNNRNLLKAEEESDKLENRFANLKAELPQKQKELDQIRDKLVVNSEERSKISKGKVKHKVT